MGCKELDGVICVDPGAGTTVEVGLVISEGQPRPSVVVSLGISIGEIVHVNAECICVPSNSRSSVLDPFEEPPNWRSY